MSFSVSRVEWEMAAPLLRNVRERVFVCEWRIPKKVEFDRDDNKAFHILVCDDSSQEPIATGRILPSGEISRIAVLKPFRKNRLDEVVLSGLMKVAYELKLQEVYIQCPLSVVEYFREHCFTTEGGVYMEAGIPRQRMVCQLDKIGKAKYYLSH